VEPHGWLMAGDDRGIYGEYTPSPYAHDAGFDATRFAWLVQR